MYVRTSGLGGLGVNWGGGATGSTTMIGTGAAVGSAFGPVGTVIGAGAGAVIGFFKGLFSKSKTQIESEQGTQVVNTVEASMKLNLQQYNAGGHTAAEQSTALANYDYLWSQLVAGCNQVSPDRKQCITDRQQGGRYDFFVTYRNPIANDPNVQTGILGSFGVSSGSEMVLMIGAGLLAVGLLLDSSSARRE